MDMLGLDVTPRAFWLVAHLVVGAIFIHSFIEALLGLRGERPMRLMAMVGSWAIALIAWATVISGTWIVYPWYRAKPPAGGEIANFPQAYLKAHSNLIQWHEFGMEWKEHVGWIAPILATAVAYVVFRYGSQLAHEIKIRRALMTLLLVGFCSAMVAGTVGALLAKMAPNAFLYQ